MFQTPVRQRSLAPLPVRRDTRQQLRHDEVAKRVPAVAAGDIRELPRAHIRGTALPKYILLPMTATGAPDVRALISWPGEDSRI